MKLPTIRVKCLNGGKLAIQVTVPRSNNMRLFKSLDTAINPDNWDAKAQKVKSKEPFHNHINQTIKDELYKLEIGFISDIREHIDLSEVNIRRRLLGLDNSKLVDFYSFCREQIEAKNYSKETRRTYDSEVTKMEAHTPDLNINDINIKCLQSYEKYMRDKLNNHPNTIWKSFKFINTMLNMAVKLEHITKNPMKDYDRGNYRQGLPNHLKWKDALLLLDSARNKPMSDYNRSIAWRALLSYFSGLRFGDAVTFDKDKHVLKGTPDRLILHTKKTGELISIAFTTYIAECVGHIDNPLTITNQEFNKGLQVACGIAGISPVSSHAMRHGFAVRCAELGMSIDEVQRLLGHNKQSTTAIYFRIADKRLDDAMGRWE